MKITLEICVDDAAGIATAIEGGADRIELCAGLALGGLTPSLGLMAIAARAPVPVMAMVRPRAGSFQWSEEELAAMIPEIAAARAFGLAGVVIGAKKPDGTLDEVALEALMRAAEGMDVTLNRAIDLTPDPIAALETCARLGIKRVLTSGGAKTALEGLAQLKAMQGHGVTIMPGSGVTAENVAQLATQLDLREVHASASSVLPAPSIPALLDFGFQSRDAKATDLEKVKALRAALDAITG